MLNRRNFMMASLSALNLPAPAQGRRVGHLVVIGGAEDKLQDRVILRRFVELSGGPKARIRILSAASAEPASAWALYRTVFAELGVSDFESIDIADRAAADSAAVSEQILGADGLFISGGDQGRLMELIWETEAFRALHVAFHLRGCCVGGTSAGAAVMSRHMLVQGEATRLPEKEVAELDIGLGLVPFAIVDQHFSERRRLGRLLSVLAQHPDMLGVGVDENTALVIERGKGVEVMGAGAVTLIDGRQMRSNFDVIDSRERLEMLGLRMHLLPAGYRYGLNRASSSNWPLPSSLREALELLVEPGPMRG